MSLEDWVGAASLIMMTSLTASGQHGRVHLPKADSKCPYKAGLEGISLVTMRSLTAGAGLGHRRVSLQLRLWLKADVRW